MNLKPFLARLFGKTPPRPQPAPPQPPAPQQRAGSVVLEHRVSDLETLLLIKAKATPRRHLKISGPSLRWKESPAFGEALRINGIAPGHHRLTFQVAEGHYCDARFAVAAGDPCEIDISEVLQGANDAGVPVRDKPLSGYLAPRKTIMAQFWVGTSPNDAAFYDLFSEAAFYAIDDDEERDNTDLNPFAGSQDEWWYDHDYLEMRALPPDEQTGQRPIGMSWSNAWEADLRERARAAGVGQFNVIVQMGIDQTKPGGHRQIRSPRNAKIGEVTLTYLGEFAFPSF